MSPELTFLLIRGLGALILYSFLGLILFWLWRDFQSAHPGVASAPRAQLVLSESGKRFQLRAHSEIGRAAGNIIRIDDETISAHHARLMYQNGQWWIEDLASRNGTEVNGILVEEPLVVSFGDEIQMGRIVARLESGESSLDDQVTASSPAGE